MENNNLYERKEGKYIFFWNGVFSQWYSNGKVQIKEDFINFFNAEQYMMYHKAKLFNDTKSAKEILNTNNPRIIKDIGRRVKNFDEDIWNEHKEKIVQQGNYLKFTQNKYLYNILIDTKDYYLVEASPYDKIWGIGLAPNNDKVLDKKNWKGLNLLGKCIMRAREDILGN